MQRGVTVFGIPSLFSKTNDLIWSASRDKESRNGQIPKSATRQKVLGISLTLPYGNNNSETLFR
jgi:hypothetical protein